MSETFTEIPLSRPDTPLLDRVNAPADLRHFGEDELLQLTDELRVFMLFCVGKTGGHFGIYIHIYIYIHICIYIY